MPHWSASPFALDTAPQRGSDIYDPLGLFAELSKASKAEEEKRVDELWWAKEKERLRQDASPGSHEMGYIPKSVMKRGLSGEWDSWKPWMLEESCELVTKITDMKDDEEDSEAFVWGKTEPCRVVIYRSQLEKLLDKSRYIDDSIILASLKSLEAQDFEVYTMDPLGLAEDIGSWPNGSAWAKMVEKELTKDIFKAKRYILLPWNTPRNSSVYPGHWSLIVLEPHTFQIRMFDSLFPQESCPRGLKTWAKNTISAWLGDHGKKWDFVASRAAQQTDSASSGAYLCAHAHMLANKRDVRRIHEGIPTGNAASMVLRKFMLSTVFAHGTAWPAPQSPGSSTYRDRVREVKRENESF